MTEAERFAESMDVSRETMARLDVYAALLKKWTPSINLVSKSTIPTLWTRHFLDSAQLLDLADKAAKTWVDFGTGGGFPGMIVAILAAEKRPALHVTCIESDLRKATFLRTVARDCGIAVTVFAKRVEDLAPLSSDVASARALAPLPILLDFAERHLGPHGEAIFLKGANAQLEIEEALVNWSFEMNTYPSVTDPNATIVKLKEIRRV